MTRDTYTGESDEPESLHLYTYCGNDGVNAWDPSGHEEIVVSGGVYKKAKKDRKKYYWEFIEPALKKLDELSVANKEKINWLIADQGWDTNDKKLIANSIKGLVNVKVKFFKNRRQFINFFRYLRVSKSEKIHSFSVFSHGAINKLMLGYDYSSNHENLYINKKDIKYFTKRSFAKDVISKFYSCKTGANNFAYKWHKHIKGKQTMDFVGKTNYAAINGNTSLDEKVSDKFEDIKAMFIGDRRPQYQPRKSKFYPTGKEMVLYTGKEKLSFK